MGKNSDLRSADDVALTSSSSLLTRSKLDLAVVRHAFMPYSSTGLTLPVYSLLRVTVSAPHVVPANFFMRAVAPWLCLQLSQFVVSKSAIFQKSPPGRLGCPQQAESGCWYAGLPSVPLLKGGLPCLILTSHCFVQHSKMLSACCSL